MQSWRHITISIGWIPTFIWLLALAACDTGPVSFHGHTARGPGNVPKALPQPTTLPASPAAPPPAAPISATQRAATISPRPILPSPSGDGIAIADQVYQFGLKIGDGADVVRQGPARATAEIRVETGTLQPTFSPLPGPEATAWHVALSPAGSPAPQAPQSLGEGPLDLSHFSGLTRVTAFFSRQDGRSGQAEATVFVDGEAPLVSLLEVQTSPGGEHRTLLFSTTDNYAVKDSRSAIMACLPGMVSYLPKSPSERDALPSTCAVVVEGDALKSLGGRLELASALVVGGRSVLPGNLDFLIYAEDLVGLAKAAAMTPAGQAAPALALSAWPSTSDQPVFTREAQVTAHLSLSRIDQRGTTKVDEASDAERSSYQIVRKHGTDPVSLSTYTHDVILPLGSADGVYLYEFTARQGALVSNAALARVIVDRTPPSVTDVRLLVQGDVLTPDALVTVSWNAVDTNGIASQILEVRSSGQDDWRTIGELPSTSRRHVFAWGAGETRSAEARIRAIDPAGNVGTGISPPWAAQVFNAAIMTASVECFICHVKIEGDVAGMNFRKDVAPRSDTGLNVEITGRFFATDEIPETLKKQAKIAGGVFEHYDNSGLKMFPNRRDADGNPVFPLLSPEVLTPRMNGSLSLGSALRFDRIHHGPLILTGTEQEPITTQGEVLIDGDVIIKGVYQGVGTIYARNIYVVGDLVAKDCLPGAASCPYPFTGSTDAERVGKAQAAIRSKRSALYLGAISQAIIGTPEHRMREFDGRTGTWDLPRTVTPYPSDSDSDQTVPSANPWLSRADFLRLCTQGRHLVRPDGRPYPLRYHRNFVSNIADPTDQEDPRTNCEVGRIDAYVYGGELVAYRSFGNFLINGGVTGAKVALLASSPDRFATLYDRLPDPLPVNAHNGLPGTISIVRYDYRLRAGGPGFETLKSLFDP